MSGEEYSDETHLLRSSNDGNGAVLAVNDGAVDGDLEAQEGILSRKSNTSLSKTHHKSNVRQFNGRI